MCGLAVIARSEAVPRASSTDPWKRVLGLLADRGPDGEGVWRCAMTGMVEMGHRRLAIQDLSPAGAQPMTAADGRIAVVFNGEVYNAPALRLELAASGHVFRSTSDTEVLLHGYEAWGFRGLLDRIRGMYAFVIWDAVRCRLFAAVDHAAMKQLFWSEQTWGLVLASTADAARALMDRPPAIDRHALADVLCHGYIPHPRTIWQGVCKLGPGQCLEWAPGGACRVGRYWSPPQPGERHATVREFEALWENVVGEHLLSDVPVGLLLSGGVDSSCVAAAVASQRADILSLTLALPGEADESPAAAATARHLGIAHETAALNTSNLEMLLDQAAAAYDEPQAHGALLTMTAVARAARAHAKVVLAGDGGDEVFAGYTWHAAPPSALREEASREAAKEHARLSRAVSEPRTDPVVRWQALAALATLSFRHAYAQSVFPRFHPSEAATLVSAGDYDEASYVEPIARSDRTELAWPLRAQHIDLGCFCAGSILPKVDRGSMTVGLEVRAPFLDRRVIEWAFSRVVAPVGGGSAPSKQILREYLSPRVPEGVLRRPKQGFSLRLGSGESFVPMLQTVRDSRLAAHGVLDPRWESFVVPGAPYRDARAFALVLLARWYEARAQ